MSGFRVSMGISAGFWEGIGGYQFSSWNLSDYQIDKGSVGGFQMG